jgi:Uma2 family endonuclease
VAVDVDIDQVHRLSLEEYHRLIESGGFDEDTRVELIDGLLVDMSPKTREHESAIRWLNRWLVLACEGQDLEVGVGNPLTLEGSEPEPDFIVVPRDAPRPYHPATAALVIEVSVSSSRRSRPPARSPQQASSSRRSTCASSWTPLTAKVARCRSTAVESLR